MQEPSRSTGSDSTAQQGMSGQRSPSGDVLALDHEMTFCPAVHAATSLADKGWKLLPPLQRRAYRDLLRRKREAFWRAKIDAERSSRTQLWRSVDALLGRGRVPPSRDFGAMEFHRYFDAKVAGMRASTADAPPPPFTAAPPGCEMWEFRPVTLADVTHAVQAMPDSQCSGDPVSTHDLKSSIDMLAPFLVELFNRSLLHQLRSPVPTAFKAAYITPLLNKPDLDPADVQSYRPISNLSFVSKLLERLVARQLLDYLHYLSASKLLSDLQSAYRAHHSTETAAVKVLADILKALDGGDLTMLLDLSVAFDTVDHAILLRSRVDPRTDPVSAVHGWPCSQGQQCTAETGSSRVTTSVHIFMLMILSTSHVILRRQPFFERWRASSPTVAHRVIGALTTRLRQSDPRWSTWSQVEQTPVSPECCCTTYLRGEQVRSCNTASTRSTLVAGARAYRF